MPRYYFHLIDSLDVLLDPEGVELPPEAIAKAALRQARDCMAGDVVGGRLDLHYRIDVHDETGQIRPLPAFADALEVVPRDNGESAHRQI